MPGGGPAHPAAGQGGWPGSLPGSPGCCACWLGADAPGLRAVTEAQFRRWCVPRDVQLGAEADPAQGARVATPGCVTHGIMPRKLHHRIARKGTAVFTKHEPERAPDVLITPLDSRQETRR